MGLELDLVVNDDYLAKLSDLRSKAHGITRNSQYPVFRFLQIEEHAVMHSKKGV